MKKIENPPKITVMLQLRFRFFNLNLPSATQDAKIKISDPRVPNTAPNAPNFGIAKTPIATLTNKPQVYIGKWYLGVWAIIVVAMATSERTEQAPVKIKIGIKRIVSI